MTGELTPRARQILAAVEREIACRRLRPAAAAGEPSAAPALRLDGALLAALELGVAGHDRAQVADRLRADHRVAHPEGLLDAVFGAGSPPRARLHRVRRQPAGG